MATVTHREMRNQSGEILRRVAAGETIEVTNNGRVAALIVPPHTDVLDALAALGQVREAAQPVSSLAAVVPRTSEMRSEDILADVRGRL